MSNINPEIRAIVDPDNKYTDEEILAIEYERDLKNIPTAAFPVDIEVTRYIEDLPEGWVTGYDSEGNLTELIATKYNEESDTYEPIKQIFIETDEDFENAKALIDQYNKGIELLADEGIMLMSSMNTLYTATLSSQTYVTFKVNYKFTGSDAGNHTITSQCRMAISAKSGCAASVTVTCGHTGLAGATTFTNYSSRTVSVSNGVPGYSWASTYNFGYWTQTVTMNTTTTSNGKTYITRKVNYRGRCSKTGNSSYMKTFTSSNIAVQFPNLDYDAPTTTLSVASRTYNSITLNISTNYHSSQASYILNSGSAVTYTTPSGAQVSGGGSYTKTFTGLSPNTAYTIQVRHYRGHTERWGAYKSISTSTTLPGLPTCSSLALVSKTYNSVTVKMSGAYGTGHPSGRYGYYRCKLSTSSTWTTVSNQNSHVISGLSPNTTYTIQAQLVDSYGQASATRTLSVTTNKPAAGTAGTVTVSSKTYNSMTFSWSGFKAGAGGSISRYEYQWNGSTTWTNNGTSTTVTKTGLSPNTSYKIIVRAIDNYSTASATATVSGTTNKPAAPTANSASISNITVNSAVMTISATAGAGGSIASYKYKINGGEEKSSTLNTISLTGLTEGTNYTITYWVVDNYGTISATKTVSFKTLEDDFVVLIFSDGTKKKTSLYRITESGKVKISKSKIKIIK